MAPARVAIVDDDERFVEYMAAFLRSRGYEPVIYGSATAFLDGGDRLLILYNDGRAFEWDPRPQSWKRHACRVAGRGLSRSEWRELFGPRAYAPVCGR